MVTRYLLPAVGVNLVAACILLGSVNLWTDPDAGVIKAVSWVSPNHAAARQLQPVDPFHCTYSGPTHYRQPVTA